MVAFFILYIIIILAFAPVGPRLQCPIFLLLNLFILSLLTGRVAEVMLFTKSNYFPLFPFLTLRNYRIMLLALPLPLPNPL